MLKLELKHVLEVCKRKVSSLPDRKCMRSYRPLSWRHAPLDSWRHFRRILSSSAVPVTSSVELRLQAGPQQFGARHVTDRKRRSRWIYRFTEKNSPQRQRQSTSIHHHTVKLCRIIGCLHVEQTSSKHRAGSSSGNLPPGSNVGLLRLLAHSWSRVRPI